jgi:TRAP transporter 4TM/12TM fusion protein
VEGIESIPPRSNGVEGVSRGQSHARLAHVLSCALAAYGLYWVVGVVDPQIYRVSFLLLALVLTFLVYPAGGAKGRPDSPRLRAARAIDWAWIALAVLSLAWPIVDFDRFVYRAATPTSLDLWLGALAILVVLEATRRSTGWVLPIVAVGFLGYAYFGPLLDRIGLSLIAHRGYAVDRTIGTLYMTLEGIFGVPLDVAATYIILFTIYGAVLEWSGGGRFFVEWAMAAVGRSRHGAGPGRTCAAAGYLLGSVSASGVANTVMLGAVAWPMMRRAGYSPDRGGAILAAAGLGALLAPPAMGAAAFLIAEYLQIPYVTVIAMALIPAALYYFSIVLMVEADARRFRLRGVDASPESVRAVTRRGGHHFLSLAAILVLLFTGMTAFRAVFWATALAAVLSFRHRETALWPRRLAAALADGGRRVLSVAATTATAGIIVGIVTLTGLGLKVAGLIVTLAAGSLPLTVVYAAVAVWVLGLAVPVTASYIIAAVMIVPALTEVGIAAAAAHMFVFYYAVLSEVSPPTALSPFAAAALTGGNPYRTTLLTWKYAAPAFAVPFVFVLDARGMGVLLQAPFRDVLWTTLAAAAGVAALAACASGWIRGAATPVERVMAAAAAVLLFIPRPAATICGAAILIITVAVHSISGRAS